MNICLHMVLVINSVVVAKEGVAKSKHELAAPVQEYALTEHEKAP